MTPVLLFALLNIFLNNYADGYMDITHLTHNHVFDLQLYEDVLDPVLCQEQLWYLQRNNTLLLAEFLDAGIRIPRGILTGNLHDMGNYHQCLNINERIPHSVIEGKYCSIRIPLDLWYSLPTLLNSPDFPRRDADVKKSPLDEFQLKRLRLFEEFKDGVDVKRGVLPKFGRKNRFQGLFFNLAICLPKVCTTREAATGLLPNTTAVDFAFEDNFCRLPNDKRRVAADYVAAVIFSLIGLLTILSTGYDVYHNVLRKKDPPQVNKICLTFSVYTNTRRLVTYKSVPGTLECLDGIRVLAMMWVIIGHTFVTQLSDLMANPLQIHVWLASWKSLWITTAPITVDTFFMLSGLLVVYTTAGKLTGLKLLKTLHYFYLNRLLRMFPILATFVLIQASFLSRVSDGPNWELVVLHTHRCRVYWWSTLLYVQNFVNPENMCLSHTWYLAIDMQLYFISPIVLFWILSGRKRYSWAALIIVLSCAIISGSIYNIIMKFPAGPVVPSRSEEQGYYLVRYYTHTLPRSPPFFIGMIYGYILHLNRNKKVILTKLNVAVLWICAISIVGTVTYSTYPIVQIDWDNQAVDTLINCLMRPAWALAIGWLVFACVHGYGGPLDWFLSLRMWKVPSRLSYAMYIVHYPLLFVVNSTVIAPVYFSVEYSTVKAINDLALATIVSFLIVILVDAPSTILIKHFMGAGSVRPQKQSLTDEFSKTQPALGSVNTAYVPDSLKREV